MQRAVKVSLKYIPEKKRRQIASLLEAYRGAVNFYVRSLWEDPGGLNKETLARLENTRLSQRYKSQALKQALDLVISTKKSAKVKKKFAKLPKFKGGAILDAKFVKVELRDSMSFDLLVKLSTLHKGHPIWLPTKRTSVFNKWASNPLARVVQGCCLSEDSLILWIELPDLAPKEGIILGCDIGKTKLLAFSDRSIAGTSFSGLCDKVSRKEKGSSAARKARIERDNYIGRTLNRIPWEALGTLVVEDLKYLKHGKRKTRSQAFRRKLSSWTYANVLSRLEQKPQENRVPLVAVPPAYTSQNCPECGCVDRANRENEIFRCVRCGHADDADISAARNILSRWTGSLESPVEAKPREISPVG